MAGTRRASQDLASRNWTSDDLEYRRSAGRSTQSLSTFTFVALWDPDQEVILLATVDATHESDHPELRATNLYDFPKAPVSDVESIYQPVLSNAASSRSSLECYRALQSRHNTLFSGLPLPELQRRRGASQTSSTLGGLDVYMKGAALSTTHRHQPVYSFLNLNTDFQFPDDSDGSETERGYLLGSTLDIERYLRNGPIDKLSDQWETLESAVQAPSTELSNSKPRSGRRLQKKRKNAPITKDSNRELTTTNLCNVFHPRKLFSAFACKPKPTPDEIDWILVNISDSIQS